MRTYAYRSKVSIQARKEVEIVIDLYSVRLKTQQQAAITYEAQYRWTHRYDLKNKLECGMRWNVCTTESITTENVNESKGQKSACRGAARRGTLNPRRAILSCARVYVFNFYQTEISTKRENCYLEDTSRGCKDTLPGTDYAAGSRGGSWKEVFPSRRPPTPVT